MTTSFLVDLADVLTERERQYRASVLWLLLALHRLPSEITSDQPRATPLDPRMMRQDERARQVVVLAGVGPGTQPALVLDDGTLLTEGAAIAQYIADRAPSKNLAPPNGTIERTKLQSWLNFFSSEMHKGGFSPLFYKGMPEEGKNVFRIRLAKRFAHLDDHLSNNLHLMGRDYSIADAHFFVVSNWASWVNFDLSPYSHVVSYRERVRTRSAVHSAMEAEGLIPWPNTQP